MPGKSFQDFFFFFENDEVFNHKLIRACHLYYVITVNNFGSGLQAIDDSTLLFFFFKFYSFM